MITLPHPVHVPTHPNHKLGLKVANYAPPRISFAHMKEHLGITVPEKPVSFDFLSDFPEDSGVLHNDTLGCCAFAGPYHGIQVAAFALKKKLVSVTALAPLVLQFYEKCGGYDPNAALQPDPDTGEMVNPTDQGGNPIDIEKWLLAHPLPLPADPALTPGEKDDEFFFCFSIDIGSEADMAYVGSECFGFGLGVIVSDAIMMQDGSIANPWPSGGNPLGGHFIWCGKSWQVISWGKKYGLTPEFMKPFNGTDMSAGNVMTATGYIHSVMFENGNTVMGKTKDQMRAYLDKFATEVTRDTPDEAPAPAPSAAPSESRLVIGPSAAPPFGA